MTYKAIVDAVISLLDYLLELADGDGKPERPVSKLSGWTPGWPRERAFTFDKEDKK